jgi:glycerol-3-phosphate dehydrogenase
MFVNYAAWEAVRLFDVPYPVAERIVRTYGSRWREVLEPILSDKRLAEPLPGSPSLLVAEVDFAIRHEMAVNVDDFLLRRSGLNWFACSALREALPAIVHIFAQHFRWSPERRGAALATIAGQAGAPVGRAG